MAEADLIMGEQDGIVTSVSDAPPAHYMVKFRSFSLLTKNNIEKYTTGDFEAGGYKWKLVIYPNGNKSKNITDSISLYLTMVEGSLAHPGSEVHAVFKMFLLDHNKDNYLTLEVGKGRRFQKMKIEWGFDRFVHLKTFNDPSNGYLVNDTCVFGAEIYVCKENTTGKGENLVMIKEPISQKHTWKLENFSYLRSDCEESKSFNAGDHKWKMQFYPRGKGSGTGGYVSLYLALADPNSLPITSQIYAEFTLRILDQINDRNWFGKANYWFNASNTFHGWLRFIPLDYLSLPSKGLLVKDNCLIEAEITVHGVTSPL